MWFEDLMGFAETTPEQVRSHLTLDGDRLTSHANGKTYGCGRLETPSLAELRARAPHRSTNPTTLREVIADVQSLHTDPANAGALFQVASQFNLLEMTGPSVTPERGVAIYQFDRTQGPACAIACGAGTIYRNYFAPVGHHIGQTTTHQIDCLRDLGDALGNTHQRYWTMRNGYALMTPQGFEAINKHLAALDPTGLDTLRARLRIGLHHDVEVTLRATGHRVTQVYGSALPVAYGTGTPAQWAPLATLVLEASYEATLRCAVENAAATGNPRVYLTLLGGGAFGNLDDWIFPAITRALTSVAHAGLDVAIVSYGRSKPTVQALVKRWHPPTHP